jgi:Rod binding domain-containing protein
MKIAALQSNQVSAADIAPESLAGNQSLSEHQKIAEASRQFEAMLLRQILSESQKPVIQSEFSDNSTAAGIYQDLATNQMADSMSKSGTFGFAQVFDRQLDHPAAKNSTQVSAVPAKVHLHPTTFSSHE